MLKTLFQRNFALLWFGGLISMMGDWMLMIARPMFVYELTGSTLAMGLMFMIGTLPRFVVSPIAGVFVDRWERRQTMIIGNLLLAVSLVPLLLVRSVDMLWLIYLSALIQSTVSRFLHPAENAMLPKLVDESHLVSANALNSLNDNLARLVGPPIGGFLVATFGFQTVVYIDAFTFLFAALMISGITVRSKPDIATNDTAPTSTIRKFWMEWREGIEIIRTNNVLRLLFVVLALTSLGEGVFATLFVPFSTDVLGAKSAGVGLLMSAQGVGGLIGSLVIGWLGMRIPMWSMLAWGTLLLGVGDLFLFNYPVFLPFYWPSLLILLLVGIPASASGNGLMSILQKHTDDRYRGRVFSSMSMVMAFCSLVGMGIAGIGGERFGIVSVINIQGYVHIIGGVLILLVMSRVVSPLPEPAAD